MEMNIEFMAAAFCQVERHDIPPGILHFSIDSFQQINPQYTDEELAKLDIVRGRDFVTIWNGKIMRGVMV
jgi:hypothetical protein